jgi:predicted PurR-regulated permease PerM
MNWRLYGLPIAITSVLLVLFWLLGPMLTPFLVAAALAYFTDPVVERLQSWKWPRTLAVLTVLLLIVLVFVLFVLLVVPLLQHEIRLIAQRLPAALGWLERVVLPWVMEQTGRTDMKLDLDYLRSVLGDQIPQASTLIARMLSTVGSSGLAIFAFLANLLLIPVIFFYLLRDWPLIKARTGELAPARWRERFTPLMGECDQALAAFVRGQILVMLALALYYTLGLMIVGLDVALLVGVLTGLASFIPYLGFSLGLLLAVLAALLQFADPTMALWVIAVFAGGQLLEGVVLQPLLLGDRIGLHPVAVIFAVLAGGQLFGFTGVLLALPTAAVALVLLRHGLSYYRQSRFYQGEQSGDIT